MAHGVMPDLIDTVAMQVFYSGDVSPKIRRELLSGLEEVLQQSGSVRMLNEVSGDALTRRSYAMVFEDGVHGLIGLVWERDGRWPAQVEMLVREVFEDTVRDIVGRLKPGVDAYAARLGIQNSAQDVLISYRCR